MVGFAELIQKRASYIFLQKKAVRAIYNLGPRDSLREKFREVDILTVASQYIFENLMNVHKNISDFKKISDIYIYKNQLLFVSLAKTREWLNGFILSWS